MFRLPHAITRAVISPCHVYFCRHAIEFSPGADTRREPRRCYAYLFSRRRACYFRRHVAAAAFFRQRRALKMLTLTPRRLPPAFRRRFAVFAPACRRQPDSWFSRHCCYAAAGCHERRLFALRRQSPPLALLRFAMPFYSIFSCRRFAPPIIRRRRRFHRALPMPMPTPTAATMIRRRDADTMMPPSRHSSDVARRSRDVSMIDTLRQRLLRRARPLYARRASCYDTGQPCRAARSVEAMARCCAARA